jgi:hypothetical protein
MLIITVLERLRQEDFEFENSLCYIKSSRPAWATEREQNHHNHTAVRMVSILKV